MPHTQALRALRRRLGSMSPTPSLLFDLMGFGHFREMAMTREGWLIAWPRRSVGFDAFLGPVSPQERRQTARLWLELDASERRLVLDRLDAQRIPAHRVGISDDGTGLELPRTRGERRSTHGAAKSSAAFH